MIDIGLNYTTHKTYALRARSVGGCHRHTSASVCECVGISAIWQPRSSVLIATFADNVASGAASIADDDEEHCIVHGDDVAITQSSKQTDNSARCKARRAAC